MSANGMGKKCMSWAEKNILNALYAFKKKLFCRKKIKSRKQISEITPKKTIPPNPFKLNGFSPSTVNK